MKDNHRNALRQIGYHVPNICGLCVHGEFTPTGASVGVCAVLSLWESSLPIIREGGCDRLFSLDPAKKTHLRGWGEFVNRRKYSRANRHKAPTRY